MYCMLLTGDRGCWWDGELRDRLRSGLDAEESTFSAAAGTTGGSGDAAVTVVMGGEDGADLEVLPSNLRPDSASDSRLTKLVRGMAELSLDSMADLLPARVRVAVRKALQDA